MSIKIFFDLALIILALESLGYILLLIRRLGIGAGLFSQIFATQHICGLLRIASQINQLTLRATRPQELLNGVCQYLAEERNYILVAILLNEEGQGLRLAAQAGAIAGQPQVEILLSPPVDSEDHPVYRVLSTREHLISSQPKRLANPAWQTAFQKAGGQSFAAFPMRHQNGLSGVLCIFANQAAAFKNPDEIKILQDLADDLAYALDNLEARQRQAFLSTAAETMRDGLLITDLRGSIIYANPAIQQMLGYNQAELQNRIVFEFMPNEQIQKLKTEYLPLLRAKGEFTTDLEMATHSRWFYFSIKSALVRDPVGKIRQIVTSVRDVTTRRLYERRLLALNHMVAELVQIHDLHELYQTILRSSEELLLADASAIYLSTNDFHSIDEMFHHKLPDECIAHLQKMALKLPAPLTTIFMQPSYIQNIAADPQLSDPLGFFANHNIQALMTLPILYQDQSFGAMILYYASPHTFEDTEKQLGLTVTNSLAIAIQNAHLYQGEHSQRQYAEALAQAAIVLNSSLDLDTVLNDILEQTIRVVPCRSVNLMLIDQDQAKVVRQLYRSSSGAIQSRADGPSIPLQTPTLQQMLASQESLLIRDTVANPIWRNMGMTTWIRSYAASPLKIRQKVIGFLNVNSDEPGFFTPAILSSLEAFASNAAAALNNANLYQALHAHTLELEDRVQERTAELSAAKDRIEAILASVPDAVFVLDEQGQLLDANQAGEFLLVQADMQNINLFTAHLIDQLRVGAPPDEKTVLEVGERSYQALASPLPAASLSGLVVVFRDVTRFREIDNMKTQFVSDVSHELRTPLTSLSLYLDLLANEHDTERRQHFLAVLQRETSRLANLIEDLLTISRLESNRVILHLQPVNITELVSNLAQDRSVMAAQRNLDLQSSVEPDLPYAVVDPRLLTQVLSNLLTNAMNYTPPGGKIMLDARLQNDEQGSWVIIAVHDTGVGILPEELPHIFERFYRGSASRATGTAGTGLGLAISTEILDRMQGKITVQSTPGAGSNFSVWLQAML